MWKLPQLAAAIGLDVAAEPKPEAAASAKEYYCATASGEQKGPLRVSEVAAQYAAGALAPDLLWCCEGMSDWLYLHQVPELAAAVGLAPAEAEREPSREEVSLFSRATAYRRHRQSEHTTDVAVIAAEGGGAAVAPPAVPEEASEGLDWELEADEEGVARPSPPPSPPTEAADAVGAERDEATLVAGGPASPAEPTSLEVYRACEEAAARMLQLEMHAALLLHHPGLDPCCGRPEAPYSRMPSSRIDFSFAAPWLVRWGVAGWEMELTSRLLPPSRSPTSAPPSTTQTASSLRLAGGSLAGCAKARRQLLLTTARDRLGGVPPCATKGRRRDRRPRSRRVQRLRQRCATRRPSGVGWR